MFEETLGQETTEGKNFVELLRSRGIYAGIKVDKGAVDINLKGEKATQGLDGLALGFVEAGQVVGKGGHAGSGAGEQSSLRGSRRHLDPGGQFPRPSSFSAAMFT